MFPAASYYNILLCMIQLTDRRSSVFFVGIQIWDKYLKNVASGNSLTFPVFLEAVKKQKNEHHLAETFGGPLPLFFHAVDANNDAQIQEDEFVLFFQIIGLNPEHAPASFKAIDTNNDGQISLNEFVAAGTEFFTSEDESLPSKLFWGPLV